MKVFLVLIVAILLLFEGAVLSSASKPTCGAVTSSKNIQLIKPAHPPSKCVYRIKKYSKDTYQLRVDLTMTLAEPTFANTPKHLTYPQCLIDYVTIGDLKLCGIETSQHLYVPFPSNLNEIEIVFVTAQRMTEEGLPPLTWDFNIYQLEWSDSLIEMKSNFSATGDLLKKKAPPAAPIGCLQYFTHNSGIITSFNYNSGWGIYPNNLNYAICIQRKLTTTALKIKLLNFIIGSDDSSPQVRFDNDCNVRNASTKENFSEDYLLIPQASIVGSGFRMDYVCGHSSTGVNILSTNPGPFALVFKSGKTLNKGVTRQGFSLSYTLI